jgi:hypothetical protein
LTMRMSKSLLVLRRTPVCQCVADTVCDREGLPHRATVSHMGSRTASATNLAQMQSADMARYAPSTGAPLILDRCVAEQRS